MHLPTRYAFSFCLLLAAQTLVSVLSAQPLPVDPSVKIGKLENGLTFYIRENSEPENRAVFRLVVNAGSTLEKDGTEGLAHFLEHIAFNGTKNFEKQELVEFIESIGMQFGADLNAYTSFDETVYMLEIPMDDEEILAKTFQILEDWAHQISFDQEEIDKERGVVLEEWRLRLGAQHRIQDEQIPVLFHDSQYAERLPIGYPEVIETIDRDAFIEFYTHYYRPDLMVLIAVGDFETAHIEALIRKHFSHIKNPDEAPPRTQFTVPPHQETLFSIATDPELSNTAINIIYKRDSKPIVTVDDYRRSIAESLYSSMLNARLRERTQEKDPPYLFAATRKQNMIRPVDIVSHVAAVEEGAFAEGLKALLVENKRARELGFSEAELKRAKANLFRNIQRAYREREQRDSSRHAGELASNFLEQEPIPGIEFEFELTQQLLPTLTLDEVNHVADNWFTETSRVILYTAPEKEVIAVPSEAEILAVIADAEGAEIEAYQEEDLSAPLMVNRPVAGKIESEIFHDTVEVTEWILSNGIRVVLKPTDFKKDQILMSAYSPGGHSLVEDSDFVAASTASQVIGGSGIGHLDAQDLRKKLAGVQAQARASIGDLYENLSGSSSPEDLETFFQLIHMRFMEPRIDEDAYAATLVQMESYMKNRLNDPNEVYGDEVEKKLFNNHPRHQPFNEDYLQAMNLQRSFEIYKDRFADAGDFTFIFVGAFELDAIRPFVKTYLASLPSQGRQETWRDIQDRMIPGQNEVVVHKGVEPKASVSIRFFGETEWSYENNYLIGAMIDVLKIPMREALREDKGGVYGVSVSGGLSRFPIGEFSTSVRFGCNPENVDELIQATYDVIEKLKTEGPDPEDLASVVEMHLRRNETSIRENGFWMSALSTYTRNAIDFDAVNQRDARAKALTAKKIQDAAIKYFDDTNRFISMLLPETE